MGFKLDSGVEEGDPFITDDMIIYSEISHVKKIDICSKFLGSF